MLDETLKDKVKPKTGMEQSSKYRTMWELNPNGERKKKSSNKMRTQMRKCYEINGYSAKKIGKLETREKLE